MKLRKENLEQGISPLQRTFSLPAEGIKTIADIKFYIKFEHSLFRTKSNSYLTQVVVDIEGLNTFVPKYFSGFSKQDKNELWDVLCDHIREKLSFRTEGLPYSFYIECFISRLKEDIYAYV